MKDRIFLCAMMAISVALFPMGACQPCWAQQSLSWKFSKGNSYGVVLEQETQMRLNNANATSPLQESATTQRTEMSWHVKDSNANGDALVEQTIERIVLQLKKGNENIVIDTNDKKPLAGRAELLAKSIQPLSGTSFVVRTKPTGEITELRLSESNQRAGGPSESELMAIATQSACRFPEKPVHVGDTWQSQYELDMREFGKFMVQTTYQYVGDESVASKTFSKIKSNTAMRLANPDSTNNVKLSRLESSGVLWFDHQAGHIDHSESQQELVLDVIQGGQTLKQEVKQKYKLQFVRK